MINECKDPDTIDKAVRVAHFSNECAPCWVLLKQVDSSANYGSAICSLNMILHVYMVEWETWTYMSEYSW